VLRIALLAVFAASAAFAAESDALKQTARKLKVKRGHPILFVDAKLVKRIRAKKDDCRRMAQTVKRYREKETDNPNDTKTIRQEVQRYNNLTHPGGYIQTSMWYGIDAYINGSALSAAYGRGYLNAILALPIDDAEEPECHALGGLFAFGALYDWLYDALDEELKHHTRLGILRFADALDKRWHFFRKGKYVGGHATCWANPYALVALIAIRHDVERESGEFQERYFELLGKVVRNIRDGIAPVHRWICREGGHHMGWDYGTCYTTMFPYLVWEFATEEPSLFDEWQNQQVFWYLYGLRNQAWVTCGGKHSIVRRAYGEYPNFGDCYGTRWSEPKQRHVLVAAFMYDNPYAKWLFNHFDVKGEDFISYGELLYKHFGRKEGKSPDDLPLARCFRHAGFAVMRDSWDFDQNTLLVFKSAPFYTMNHHHKDQNSFTIYYKGPLAIDSGGYALCGKYGSRHWFNYYTRSVAHNTILIYDPEEDFGTCRWGKLSNDGGQAFLREAGSVEDLTGKSALDGIQRYENRTEFAYVMGDATKAYSAHKLERFRRHVVYLRRHSYNHPAIVVYDEVVSKNPSFKKTYLLHSIAQPAVEGKLFSVEITDGLDQTQKGRLYDEVFLPLDADIEVIGGIGREFFVADDGTGKPHNYREEFARTFPEIADQPAIEREMGMFRELGEWRVEISSKKHSTEDRFLNVLSVTDGSNRFRPVRARYLDLKQCDGVVILDNDGRESTVVLFKRDEAPFQEVSLKGVKCRKALLVGLQPETRVTVRRAAGKLRIIRSTRRGRTASDAGVVYLDLKR